MDSDFESFEKNLNFIDEEKNRIIESIDLIVNSENDINSDSSKALFESIVGRLTKLIELTSQLNIQSNELFQVKHVILGDLKSRKKETKDLKNNLESSLINVDKKIEDLMKEPQNIIENSETEFKWYDMLSLGLSYSMRKTQNRVNFDRRIGNWINETRRKLNEKLALTILINLIEEEINQVNSGITLLDILISFSGQLVTTLKNVKMRSEIISNHIIATDKDMTETLLIAPEFTDLNDLKQVLADLKSIESIESIWSK